MKEMHFFISLEKEVEDAFNFIEPDESNLRCYGAKFVTLLNTIGIEFESLAKSLIKSQRPDAIVGNIGDIKQNLLELFPNLCSNEVEITRLNQTRFPFDGWDNGERLDWWTDYTDIKHNRLKNYPKANLDTVLQSMAALVIIIVYLGKLRDNLQHIRSSGLFIHKSMGADFVCKGEPLPDDEA